VAGGADRARHVLADEVVIATNGYTGDVTPELKRRVVPLASHIIATEELPPDLAASLIPKRRTLSDTRRVLCYYRMSPDGRRMIFGGRARFTPVTPQQSAPILHRFMTDRFPQLRDTKITHAWTGNVAFTLDALPHMGQQDGMHYLLGCNGSGVAMMTYLGWQTARKIAGVANQPSAFDTEDFPTIRCIPAIRGSCRRSADGTGCATTWIAGWRCRRVSGAPVGTRRQRQVQPVRSDRQDAADTPARIAQQGDRRGAIQHLRAKRFRFGHQTLDQRQSATLGRNARGVLGQQIDRLRTETQAEAFQPGDGWRDLLGECGDDFWIGKRMRARPGRTIGVAARRFHQQVWIQVPAGIGGEGVLEIVGHLAVVLHP
jgi:hypothetical protein